MVQGSLLLHSSRYCDLLGRPKQRTIEGECCNAMSRATEGDEPGAIQQGRRWRSLYNRGLGAHIDQLRIGWVARICLSNFMPFGKQSTNKLEPNGTHCQDREAASNRSLEKWLIDKGRHETPRNLSYLILRLSHRAIRCHALLFCKATTKYIHSIDF